MNGKGGKIFLVATALALGLVATLGAAAGNHRDEVYFPEGYRLWTLMRFRFPGPDSPNYEKQGGMRHYFANDLARKSWGKGRFREGSTIVDERVHATLNEQGVWEEGGLAHVAVMRKDSKRYPQTGGWYFNYFTAHDTAIGLTEAQAKAACFDACHKSQSARDFVFSDPRH